MKNIFLFAILITLPVLAKSQTLVTTHIYTADSSFVSEKYKIMDMAWLAGTWKGEAFGGQVEEIWSEPLGNSMMASFKLVVDGKVEFYEIELIRELEDQLVLQLKHFAHDLKGWEEKDITIDFPLIKINSQGAYFNGMTFEKINDTQLNVYVLHQEKDGSYNEWIFNYYK